MITIRTLCFLKLLLLLPFVLGGCDDEPLSGPSYDYHVDASEGSDSNPGTPSRPFKTISKAAATAGPGESIKVAPGTYDAANGEVFPIVVAEGVSLIGNEANKGGGRNPTVIHGSGQDYGSFYTTLTPGPDAVVAGFTLINDTDVSFADYSLCLRNSGVTVRNNRLVDGDDGGLYVYNGSGHQVIAGNVIEDTFEGLRFSEGGYLTRVENNEIRNNAWGVIYDTPGGDMGGGGSGSAGGNVIACNSTIDLWTDIDPLSSIYAVDNFWDHAPPAGNDIGNERGAIILTAGAQVASPNCP